MDVLTKDFWAYWETVNLLKYPWNEFRCRSGLLAGDNSQSDADVPSKWAVLWAEEQYGTIASIILQRNCRYFLVSRVWTKMYFTFFATFDCYIDACFMARWRITVPCSKLICRSGPSINFIARISTI